MAGLFEVGLHSTKPSTVQLPSTLDLTVEADETWPRPESGS